MVIRRLFSRRPHDHVPQHGVAKTAKYNSRRLFELNVFQYPVSATYKSSQGRPLIPGSPKLAFPISHLGTVWELHLVGRRAFSLKRPRHRP